MNSTESVDPRIEREKKFHDDRFEDDPRKTSTGIGMTEMATRNALQKTYKTIAKYAAGSRILDYGCALGEASFIFVRYGADFVEAIDLSSVAVDQAKASAVEKGIDNVAFQAMNAEQLEFDDNSFDLVCGFAILHHLDLDRSYSEIARVLKPDGHAVFLEPLGHNPAINMFRNATPTMRTPDEHPFMMDNINLANKYFEQVQATHTNLLTLASLPFSRIPGSKLAFNILEKMDRILFKVVPFSRRYSWNAVLDFSKPRKPV